jgi:hypothetical protein
MAWLVKNLLAFIKRIWDGDTLVSKQEGFFGAPFDVGRGLRCGDIDSPVIFNIVVDAIIRDIAASGDHIILLQLFMQTMEPFAILIRQGCSS